MSNESATRLVGYFPASSIPAQNYHVADIPAAQLTHIVYAFAQLNPDGSCVSISPDDDAVNFPALRDLKQRDPNVQTLISIGGASHSTNFSAAAASDATRARCAQSCAQFMKQNGFDGVDIDWEFPAAADSQNFTALLAELRRELNALGTADKRSYLLTIAAPAGKEHYSNLQLDQIHRDVDWINLMAYDFTVASSASTDFVAPLKAYDPSVARHADSNVDDAVQAYLKAGVPAEKLVLGTRFVGTGWQGVADANNGLYQSNRGPAKGTWDAADAAPSGSFGYQDIERNYVKSGTRFWHVEAASPWAFDPATGIMISYEDPQSLALKANYILANTLGGAMIWNLSADDGAHTLLNSLVDGLGRANDLVNYTVSGRVASPDSASVGGLLVQLMDKAIGSDTPLAAATTSAAGEYKMSVKISNATLETRRKARPDFQVRVSIGQTFLAASEVRYNASANETLDVTLPSRIAALPSEYETLTAALVANYGGKAGELQENDERQDITYLANKTGWDARAVAMAALADQFSQITAPVPAAHAAAVPATAGGPGAAPVQAPTPAAPITTTPALAAPAPAAGPAPVPAATPTSLKPEFYYALFRAGFPANADGLFQASPKAAQAVWQQAIKQNVIPQSLAGELPNAAQTFAALSAAQMLTGKPPIGVSNLPQMLQASWPNITAQQQQEFAQIYTQNRDDLNAFWSQIETSFGKPTADLLQFHGKLYTLTLNNVPLVSALIAAEHENPLNSLNDLVGRGYYDAAKWGPLIGDLLPTEIPGNTADERRSNYAQLLAAQVRLAFPTAVIADRVTKGGFPLSNQAAQNGVTPSAVANFLTTNQEKFEIGVEPVKAYVARTKLAAAPAVVGEITRLQRALQLTPDDQTMAVLLQHNLDSAYAITRHDSAGFARAFSSKLGGKVAANRIYARAKQIHGVVLSAAVSYLSARRAPTIGGRSPVHVPFLAPTSNPNSPIIAYPTLETLFGSLDYCSCEDCRSILSPAAYLVDLLHYLDQRSPTPGYQNPQSVLFQRRPDLQYLPLTCENTNTALPYIDIANETLEYFVANGCQSLSGYQGHDTGDSVSSTELMASAQYVSDAVYTTLQSAYFPPPLPFNRPLELLRQHMQKLGVALPDLMIALRANDNIDRPALSSTDYVWRDILIEQLGISREEYRVFTDSSIGLSGLYGYPVNPSDPNPNGTVLTQDLEQISLQDYSRRTDVTYDDLFSIVKTQFINPDAILITRLEHLGVPFTTLQQLNNGSLTAAAFESLLPAQLDATQYGGKTATDKGAVVSWVNNNFPRIMNLITITNPNPVSAIDQCSGASLQLRYSNPDNTANKLTAADFVRLIRFIRLWQKLGLSIEQTDDLLSALFPGDATSIELLDRGFVTFLSRAGFFFQVMNRLNFSPDVALSQLLTCWAPIDTAGDAALYQKMFLTPTALRDTGAKTATIAGPFSAGDVLTTVINGIAVAYTVQSSDVQATDAGTIANVAGNIVSRINSNTTIDPTTGLPLNSRIYAAVSSQSGVIAIQAGFTLTCSPPGKYAAASQSTLSRTATVAGTVALGDMLTTTINNIDIQYTVATGDTATTVAAQIVSAINNTTIQDPFSGLPLNTLVLATSVASVITVNAINSSAPITLACSLSQGDVGAYSVGPFSLPGWLATIGGSVHAGNTLLTTINNATLSYTATASDTDTSVLASSIAKMINESTVTDSLSTLSVKDLVAASASGGDVILTAKVPATSITLGCSMSLGPVPVESTYTAIPQPAGQTAFVNGPFVANRVLVTTINGISIPYTTVAGDDAVKIPAKVANAINATTTLDPATNLPLNSLVSAEVVRLGMLGVTAKDPATTFTMATSILTGSYTVGKQTSPFAADGYGNFLADSSQTLFGHESAICAASNLTGAEFALIAAAQTLPFDASTRLTLANVSTIFRFGWLAHALGMSVREFLLLRQFSRLDPFLALDPSPTSPTEPPAIRFIRMMQSLSAAGIKPTQALYLMWNQDISGKSAPPLAAITGLARSLRSDFAAIEAQFALVADPDGTIAKGLMALVYGGAATDFFFSLLNNTMATSVAYSQPQPTLAQSIVDASGGRLFYDDFKKQLTFAGVFDPATQAAITQAITVNTSDTSDNISPGVATFTPASMTNITPGTVLVIDRGAAQEIATVTQTTAKTFSAIAVKAHNGGANPFPIVGYPTLAAAISGLAAAYQMAVGPFFAAYSELLPLLNAYVASSDLVQTKRNVLLADILPSLKQKRKLEQALADATEAAGSDPSFAAALLQDPSVLHATAAAASPAVADFTAIEAQGLSAQFYLNNVIRAVPDQSVDAVPALSYSQTATIGGTPQNNDTLTTTINGVAIHYVVSAKDSSLAVLASNVAVAINAATLPTQGISAQVSLVNSNVIVLTGVDPSGANSSFSLTCSVSAGAKTTYTSGSQLPAGQGGSPIAGVWTGYITALQDGLYDIAVATDVRATVVLSIGGAAVPIAASGNVWANQRPISLTAGALTPIVLTVTGVKQSLSVSWKTIGSGWQAISGQYLYASTLIDRLQATYVRFLKATSLASALSLTANEIAWLGTAGDYRITTIDSRDKFSSGSNTFTPGSIANIKKGSLLVIDVGDAQEVVTVIGTTGTTFSATTVKAHDGTVTPFPIVSAASAKVGQGWLNFLAAPDTSNSAILTIAADLRDVLTSLLDYARIKQALSPSDERLLAVLQSPASTLPNGVSALLSLTGWDVGSRDALLNRYSLKLADLSAVENFRRVYDAYAFVRSCRISAALLIAVTTNAPSATTVAALQSALRALYAEPDWLTVVRPINDLMRIRQRDALVAYILQQLGDQYEQTLIIAPTSAAATGGDTTLSFANTSSTAQIKQGMQAQGANIPTYAAVTSVAVATNSVTVIISPGILGALPAGALVTFDPGAAPAINTADKLFEYFLIDVQTQPPVETSRVRLALSSVQLFIERILRNLEPQISPSDIDGSLWPWMKRYRVWQANREVFLWPENWLYPELRDDQSPFFQETMSALLQSDITDDAAANAYLDYLTKLEEVAKLEPCGLYYLPATADANEISYVVARTAGAHRKHYFRKLENSSWTPWTEVKIDCEDMPITPIVWNGRLFLFWLKVLKQPPQDGSQAGSFLPASGGINDLDFSKLKAGVQAAAAQNQQVEAHAVLCWSEFYNGKWQPTKTSDINRPASLGTFAATGDGSFEAGRNLFQIVPVQFIEGVPNILPPGALVLAIQDPRIEWSPGSGDGFVINNTHSLPIRIQDLNYSELYPFPTSQKKLSPIYSYTGGMAPVGSTTTFNISYPNGYRPPPPMPIDRTNHAPTEGGEQSYPFGPVVSTNALFSFYWVPRYVASQTGLWDAPFFYEDRRNVFYVTTTESLSTISGQVRFGILPAPGAGSLTGDLPPLALRPSGKAIAKGPNAGGRVAAPSPEQTDIRARLGSASSVRYQGREISTSGSVVPKSTILGANTKEA